MRLEELMQMERVVVEENEWRHRPANVYTRDGLALVSKVRATGRELKSAVREAVDSIGGLRKSLGPGDRVYLKANFNSADPPPARTDVAFLGAVVELLREEGITNLALGERCGWPSLPTMGVLQQSGALDLCQRLGVRVIDFDPGPWMSVHLGPRARWWEKGVAFHQSLKEFDKIVYVPALKHHRLARFTMSLKLPVGMMDPVETLYMHADMRFGKTDEPMWEKMIELSLPVGPDLIVMDGRKAFVTEGPMHGEVVEPGFVLASGDRIALDVEGVRILQTYPRDNLLQMPVWEMPVIRRAVELGLGVASEAGYRVLGGE